MSKFPEDALSGNECLNVKTTNRRINANLPKVPIQYFVNPVIEKYV